MDVWIDDKMAFENPVETLLKKGNQKLYVFMRVSKYKDKLQMTMKVFIESKFN